MEVKLVVVGGKNAGQSIAVVGPIFNIGRSEECQLRPRSDQISRRHCAIFLEEGRVTVRDFKSRNGTFVNGEEIKGERELKMGDHLKVGPLEFEVQLAVSVSGKKKPKVHNVKEAAQRSVGAAAAGEKEKEMDVAGWLADQDDADDTVSLTMMGDTIHAPPAQYEPEMPKSPAASQERIDPMADPNTTKKPTAPSSRVAADEMLKQYFKRR